MATSGSFVTTGYSDDGYPDYYVYNWSVVSQNIETATTTIKWSLVGAGGATDGRYTIVKKRSVTVNGSAQEVTSEQWTYNGTVAFSGTTTIQHNTSTGVGSFSASAKGAFYYTEYNSTGSGTWDLPTIPRATKPTLSASSVTMGGSITITLAPANSSFKHKIRYRFGGVYGHTTGLSVEMDFTPAGNTTVKFTPPISLANYIPTAFSDVCTIFCYTYNSSGTQIGNTTSVDLTLNVPSYTPKVDSITLTGNNLLGGEYVKGKSSVNVTAKVSTSYGAYIKDFTTTIEGLGYTAATTWKSSTLEHTITSEALSAGTKTFPITVTDSRGKTATTNSSSITVYDYSAPYITNFSLERQSNGTTVIARLIGGVSPVNNKNAKGFAVILNGVTKEIASSSYTINGETTFTNVPTDNTLTATAMISDSYTSVSTSTVLPTVAVTMDFYKDGTGIAMGKVAEMPNTLDIAWKVKNHSIPTLLGGTGNFIAGNSNLSDEKYLIPGNYLCASNNDTNTLKNCPSNVAFKMCVHNCLDVVTDAYTAQWMYLVREITNIDGKSWIQFIRKEGGNWNFGGWSQILDSSICADYVVEQGTWDGWEYTKWKNGKIELYGDRSLTFPVGTTVATNLNRSIATIDLSGLLTNIISGNCPIQYNGMVPQFCRHTTYKTTAEIIILTNRSIDGFTITVPVYITGRWK